MYLILMSILLVYAQPIELKYYSVFSEIIPDKEWIIEGDDGLYVCKAETSCEGFKDSDSMGLQMIKQPSTTVRASSMRGVVLSYVLSEPGIETVQTITDDLNTEDKPRDKLYRIVYMAVDSLRQRGLVRMGDGPNKSNKKLWPTNDAVGILS